LYEPRYKGFHSVHSKTLPELQTKEFFIGNLDLPNQAGTHWVLVFRTSPTMLVYFDSFGIPPGGDIAVYAFRSKSELKHQKHDLQDFTSTLCGYYVIYMADELMKGRKFSAVLDDFTKDPSRQNVNVLKKHFT
jgi:hypothetical protein